MEERRQCETTPRHSAAWWPRRSTVRPGVRISARFRSRGSSITPTSGGCSPARGLRRLRHAARPGRGPGRRRLGHQPAGRLRGHRPSASRRSSTSLRCGERSTRSSGSSSRRPVRHHLALQLPHPRLSRRLLAAHAQLPAPADARTKRGWWDRRETLVPAHGDGRGHQDPRPPTSRRAPASSSRRTATGRAGPPSSPVVGRVLRGLGQVYRSKGERYHIGQLLQGRLRHRQR